MSFRNMVALIGMSAIGAAGAAHAQTAYWPAPTSASQMARTSYFPLGTPLTLTTRTEVSTKDNKAGDRFYLEVAENLSYRGQVVVPAGSVAVGEVARVQRNGHFGKKGKVDIALLYVQTPAGPIRLTGKSNDEGTSGAITSFATIALVSPLGFLVHGTSARIPAGALVRGYLAQDLRFAIDPRAAQTASVPQGTGAEATPDSALTGRQTAAR